MPFCKNGQRELALNLDYAIKDVMEGFRRLRGSPIDTDSRERWLTAMARFETASEQYLAAVASTAHESTARVSECPQTVIEAKHFDAG